MPSEREIVSHFIAGSVMYLLLDIAIAAAVTYFTDTGITGFIVTFVVLQVIVFLSG